MIGRVCKVFPGHTLHSCLSMTVRQLYGMYWESMRQGARTKLGEIQVHSVLKGGKGYKTILSDLERQAFPPDPEADGEFTATPLKRFFASVGKNG